MKKGKYFTMKNLGDKKASIDIFGEIVSEDYRWYEEDTSAVSFRDALNELGDVSELEIHINSPGGDVFSGVAIANMIKQHPAKTSVYIDGLAASIATTIASSADHVYMASNSMYMIHNAMTGFYGNHNDMRKVADTLEHLNNSMVKQSYIDKNPAIDVEALSAMMDNETWLSASEAFALGLIDEVLQPVQVAASITKEQMERFNNVPKALSAVDDEPIQQPVASIDKEYLDNALAMIREEMKALKQVEEKPKAKNNFFLNLN
ncbi:head maturation protease, ClpP-related [Planococcus kocurii]|uniref:head maturation protease, ClpP-related n=1 Tax=Planococcus kocurii TaxID=1374 RepID=UPI003D0862E5